MVKHNFTHVLLNESATLSAGQRFAEGLSSGMTIYLHGDLGAGKTTFVRGVLRGLGYQGKVKSPTYTLVEPYDFFKKQIYHFDLYRFTDEEEWDAFGFREYFNPSSICMIEWSEKAQQLLPMADIEIYLSHQASGRLIQYNANTELGRQLLVNLEKNA
ncbi:MAG TPA: tRNA (adenosine(37)-N6)-threonylcarbamoyltransferase complex ATPase subunit type 1 TsaE [Methylophilaceae bacterium]|nr:tRNA (adenosine(37)-N6)-threonylcarbamoyltransferase complex ATPase subunit type 1 TsaE [Methylophilaceae bacterium]HAJ72968.1 tRNA (adenosine(37)-N6)-threonylcarbamoyltransferase complex ATPase subunit type 1 TsaE [Methylophilaceae bacterium]